MVEKLTDKNLSLGEEVAELRSLVYHLEAVVRASEDIEDEHVAVETQLQRMRMEFVFFLFIIALVFSVCFGCASFDSLLFMFTWFLLILQVI